MTTWEPHPLTNERLEGGVGGIFWRDVVIGVEDAKTSRVLKWMLLITELVQEATESLKFDKKD